MPVLERQRALRDLLAAVGLKLPPGPMPNTGPLVNRKAAYQQLYEAYRLLGGTLAAPPLGAGHYDFAFGAGYLELDEEQHFNRYRELTLRSALYDTVRPFADYYGQLCREREDQCLEHKSGAGFWTSRSCEAQFGSAGPPRLLDGPGAPRWKQRAFYDMVKDAAAMVQDRPVVRLSVWDRVELPTGRRQLGWVLDTRPERAACAVRVLFDRRLSEVEPPQGESQLP